MATNGKILVTGATGSIGSVLIENLTKAGAGVRALVRDKSKGSALKDAGVELAIGDLSRPETLDAAFAGVSKVYLLTAFKLAVQTRLPKIDEKLRCSGS